MQWLRDGLAKLLNATPQDSFFDVQLVVFFPSSHVFRYVKGRVYDKPFHQDLDPTLLQSWHQQQAATLLHADTIVSPYSNASFSHQYVHVLPLSQGLLLIQQADFQPLPAAIDLLIAAVQQLLGQALQQQTVTTYRQWLLAAGMNDHTGVLHHDGEYFTPHPPVDYPVDSSGFYPLAALFAVLHTPCSLIEVVTEASRAHRLLSLHDTWYRHEDRYVMIVPLVDKRVLNRYVKDIQRAHRKPFDKAVVHVARSSDPVGLFDALLALRSSDDVYYPPTPPAILDDVAIAVAATRRRKVRNQTNQWVADIFAAPPMSVACELQWWQVVLKQPVVRTRYVFISDALAMHADTAAFLKAHKMGTWFAKTAIIADRMDPALRDYLRGQHAIIGCRSWDTLMREERDVFFFDRVVDQRDEALLDYLYHRQMSDGLTCVFPVTHQRDVLWLINHSVGLYYMEGENE